MNNYLSLLKRIGSQNPPIFIFGGFAEEALLNRKITRKHEDIDILVLRKDIDNYVVSTVSMCQPLCQLCQPTVSTCVNLWS